MNELLNQDYQDTLFLRARADTMVRRECTGCSGVFKHHVSKDDGGMTVWQTWTGSCRDDGGRWVNIGSTLTPCSQDPTGHLHLATLRPLRNGHRPPIMEYGMLNDTLGFNYDPQGAIKGYGGHPAHNIFMITPDNEEEGDTQPVTPPPAFQ